MEKMRVKVIAICGSARHASTEWACKLALKTAEELGYVDTELIHLGDLKLVPCVGCMQCFGWQAPADAGPKCFKFNDDTEFLNNKTMEADGVILATPIYVWGPTALMRIYIEKLHVVGPMSFSRFEGSLRGKAMGVITVGGVDTSGQEAVGYHLLALGSGLGMWPVAPWPTTVDPNPVASMQGAFVSAVDAKSIYAKDCLSKEQCRTVPPTQGIRNERSIRNLGRHVAVAAMTLKLGMMEFKKRGFKEPQIVPSFTKYSVKPKKGTWLEKLMEEGKVKYIPKE